MLPDLPSSDRPLRALRPAAARRSLILAGAGLRLLVAALVAAVLWAGFGALR